MNWKGIQERDGLIGQNLQMQVFTGGDVDAIYRGQVKLVEWIAGFPVFHLLSVLKLDQRTQKWLPAENEMPDVQPYRAEEVQRMLDQDKRPFNDPVACSDNRIEFTVLDGLRIFSLQSRG